jgi:hypothetical protein
MFLRWEKGRQVGSYSKLALIPLWLSKLINSDAYILSFPAGCSVIKHRDLVAEGYKHYRMNLVLRRPDNGRRMYCLGPVKRFGRIEIFRPDLYDHGLEPITGSMLMLSFGCRVKTNSIVR